MAVVNIGGKLRKNWPAVALVGKYWAITLPVTSGRKPWKDAPFVCITHQPTGLKAAEAYPDDARRITNRIAKIFGNARTKRGVMRKYGALSDTKKRWVRRQQWWLAKKGGR